MRGLAEYVMRGRKQAVLVILLFNLIPFLGWLGDVIMALVTLRKGAKEGAFVLLWAILPSVVFAIIGYSQLWIYNVVGGSLIIYLLALVLRSTNSWANVLYCATLVGILGVVLVHLYNPEITNVWIKQLGDYLQLFKAKWGGTPQFTQMQLAVPVIAKIGTGMQVIFVLLGNLIALTFARWWQSLLYNPGALAPELRNIRLGFIAVGILAVLMIGSISDVAVAIDSMPVAVLPFVLVGLSLLHGVAVLLKLSKVWLVGFYGLWVMLFPYLTLLLAIAALMDCWFDFRHRLQLRNI